jgi:hypothetical protein
MTYPKKLQPKVATIKFMQTATTKQHKWLLEEAAKKDISIQELIRYFILPEVMKKSPDPKRSFAIRKAWETRRKNAQTDDESSAEFATTPPPWETQTGPKEGNQS